jgi:hypothetical protein
MMYQSARYAVSPKKSQALPILLILAAGLVVFFVMLTAGGYVLFVDSQYKNAQADVEKRDFSAAVTCLGSVPGFYKDSSKLMMYAQAGDLFDKGQNSGARALYTSLGNFKDSTTMVQEINYRDAVAQYENKEYTAAASGFGGLAGYKEAGKYLVLAQAHMLAEGISSNYDGIKVLYRQLADVGDFKDANELKMSDAFILYYLEGDWVFESDGKAFTTIRYDKAEASWFIDALKMSSNYKFENGILSRLADGAWQKFAEFVYISDDSCRVNFFVDISDYPDTMIINRK